MSIPNTRPLREREVDRANVSFTQIDSQSSESVELYTHRSKSYIENSPETSFDSNSEEDQNNE